MTVKTLYVTTAAAETTNRFAVLQDGGTAPTAANTAYGWKPAKTAVTTPFWGAQLGSTTTSAVAASATSTIASDTSPTKGTSSTATGDSFIAGPYSGSFANTAWTFAWNMRAGVAGAIGRLRMRVWISANADGTSATELTASVQVGATVTLSTSADTNSSMSWSPGAITLNNEYLFFQVEWEETTAGSSNTDTVLFRAGTAAITTPSFANAYSLAATSGSFGLTGNADTNDVGLPAGSGSFALTGRTLANAIGLPASSASFSLAGFSAALVHLDKLAAASGSFALTGNAAGLRSGFNLAATSGSFVLAGYSSALVAAHRLASGSGTFATTGYSAGETVGTPLNSGSLSLTGNGATLTYSGAAPNLAADAASFALTGRNAGFQIALPLVGTGGDFGPDFDPSFALTIYTLTGYGAALAGTPRYLAAGSGSFSVTGNTASAQGGQPAPSGSFSLSGSPAACDVRTPLGTRIFSLDGNAANLVHFSGPAFADVINLQGLLRLTIDLSGIMGADTALSGTFAQDTALAGIVD